VAQPLRRQIAVIFLVLTPVVYAAIGWGAYLTYGEHLRLLGMETSTMATTVVVFINRNLATADVVAATASRHPGIRGLDPAAVAEVLLPLVGSRDSLLNNALVANAEGQVKAWARPPDAAVEGRVDPAWLAKVVAAGQPQVSPMLGGPGESTHSIMLGYPILSIDNQRVGVLALAVHLEALEEMLKAIPLPDGSVVTVTDQDSVVVARSLDSARYVGRPIEAPGKEREPANVPSTVIRTGVDGVERVFGNGVVARGPWLASVGIPTSVAMARSAPIFRRNLAISIASTVLIFGAAFVFGRRWLKAFDHLDDAAKRVSRGDLSPLDPHPMPTAEMEHLQQTVSGMITNLQSARESIAAQVDDERRMREELQSLQQQVIRQERLAAIGVLVSGVAHELNNPLQAILGFSELLQMQKDMPESARADLTLIQKESARASAIIRNLSRFGRQMSEPTPVKLRDVIASVMELRQRKLAELNIRVEVDEKSVGLVMAIFTELQQVLLNFAINAEQAIVHSDTGRRQVVVRSGDRDGWAWLEVEDSGPGVPPEHEAKLFQPFYTTKPVGEGTGLGLSVSYDIIRSHGGRIGYRRAASGGAVFFFELPIVPAEESSAM
jgi:C4-dicarboxylate-specific signal transduction histidine kinase